MSTILKVFIKIKNFRMFLKERRNCLPMFKLGQGRLTKKQLTEISLQKHILVFYWFKQKIDLVTKRQLIKRPRDH